MPRRSQGIARHRGLAEAHLPRCLTRVGDAPDGREVGTND
jgi:hypothetical protein